MLWLLLLLAGLAVMMILFGGFNRIDDVVGVIIATGITLGVTMGLGYLCVVLADKPWGRYAGWLGLGGLMTTMVFILTGVWAGMIRLSMGRGVERLLITGVLVFLFSIPGICFLLGMNYPRGKRVGVAGVILSGISLGLCLMSLWNNGNSSNNYGDFAAGFMGFSIPILGSLVGAGVDRRPWRYLGVAMGVVGIGFFGNELFKDYLYRDNHLAVLMFCLSMVMALANVLMLYPLKGGEKFVPAITFISGGLACGLSYYLYRSNAYEWSMGTKFQMRESILYCSSILAICGTAGTLLLAAFNKKTERPKVVYTPVQKMQIVCPCCGEKQELTPGDGRCVKCKLVIKTAFEEPKCETCGYSMLMLQSDKCPECGTAAPWAIAVAPTPSSAMGS